MNNQIWPGKDRKKDLGFDEYLELFKSYDRLLGWLLDEVSIQNDPKIMRPIRRAQFKLPLNI